MSSRQLVVLIAGQVAGTVTQGESGQLSFSYERNYDAVPLSTSMTVSNRAYPDSVVRPFLFGLLPDDPAVRRSLGERFGVSGNNPFDLLRHVGLDCPGAVQLCPEEGLEALAARRGSLEEISDEGIAKKLRHGKERASSSWTDPDEHWSLGGAQSKFALRLEEGKWHRCLGSAATTHIFKGGIVHLELQALNEFLCLKLARACGVPAARVEYLTFDGEPAVVVERFDRVRNARGEVVRIHQEDLCQALGVLPENKYAQYGGPSTPEVTALLLGLGSNERRNVLAFVEMLFFNYLVAAPDAHAKNYSLLFGGKGEMLLAPLYDVASMFPYVRPREKMRMAMSIGGENRIGHLSCAAVERFATGCGLVKVGLSASDCVEVACSLAEEIAGKIEGVFEQHAAINGVDELHERMAPKVVALCEATESRLARPSSRLS